MINGVKITLVYHLYCKSVEDIETETGNWYNEINRRCLKHFHDVFDEAVFCICVDDIGDSKLVQAAIDWIWSCGFKSNVTLKVKQNSPYRDAQTFYDEIANKLDDIEGVVFFGHNKGSTMKQMEGLKQWIAFSYFACLDRIKEYVPKLADNTMVYCYAPYDTREYITSKEFDWFLPGTYFLLNPRKVVQYLKRTGQEVPKLTDRYSAELFFPKIVKLYAKETPAYRASVSFEDWCNCAFTSPDELDYYTVDHFGVISYFLSEERVNEYKRFYENITKGLQIETPAE